MLTFNIGQLECGDRTCTPTPHLDPTKSPTSDLCVTAGFAEQLFMYILGVGKLKPAGKKRGDMEQYKYAHPLTGNIGR